MIYSEPIGHFRYRSNHNERELWGFLIYFNVTWWQTLCVTATILPQFPTAIGAALNLIQYGLNQSIPMDLREGDFSELLKISIMIKMFILFVNQLNKGERRSN